jgi:hypothetical protein
MMRPTAVQRKDTENMGEIQTVRVRSLFVDGYSLSGVWIRTTCVVFSVRGFSSDTYDEGRKIFVVIAKFQLRHPDHATLYGIRCSLQGGQRLASSLPGFHR